MASHAHHAAPERPAQDEIGLLQLLSALVRRRRIVVGIPLLAALLAAGTSLLLPPAFTATVTFVPEVSSRGRLPSELTGLASQFGIAIGSEASQSPRFYAEVVKSRELLERTLLSQYPNPSDEKTTADSVTLLHVLRGTSGNSTDSVEKGFERLGKLIAVSVDNQTGIVTLSVDAPYPTLAAAVANRLVEYLNDFNTRNRQSQARERRKFIERRIEDGQRELRSAEEDLRTFYERNRSWQQAPQLVFEEGRLRRQVDIRQQVYLTLRREYETARIQEVNDTPVITVIDSAVPPSKRSKPRRKVILLLALCLGGIVGLSWALGAEYVDRLRHEEQGEYARLTATLRQARHEVFDAFGTRRGQGEGSAGQTGKDEL